MNFWWGGFNLVDSITKRAECVMYTHPCAKVMVIEYAHQTGMFTLRCLGQQQTMKVLSDEIPLVDYTWAMAEQDLEKVKVYAISWLKLVIAAVDVSLKNITTVLTKTGG